MDDKAVLIEKYRQENKTASYGQTVFIGSYRVQCFPINELLAEHNDDTIIYNRGIGGYLVYQITDALDLCAYDLKPSKVFINLSTSDLSWHGIHASLVAQKYDIMFKEIKQNLPEAEIYIVACYPVNYDVAGEMMKIVLERRNNPKINALNIACEKLAEKYGFRFINFNDKLSDEQGRLREEYTDDGNYINEVGYRVIYDEIMPYVKGEK